MRIPVTGISGKYVRAIRTCNKHEKLVVSSAVGNSAEKYDICYRS